MLPLRIFGLIALISLPAIAEESAKPEQLRESVCNLARSEQRLQAIKAQNACLGNFDLPASEGARRIAASPRFKELSSIAISAGLKSAANQYANMYVGSPRFYPMDMALAAGIFKAWEDATKANALVPDVADKFLEIWGDIWGCPYRLPSAGWCENVLTR